MKKILFASLLFCLTAISVKADLGSSVLYSAKFYLKNGTIFKGSFECTGDWEGTRLDSLGRNQFCNDEGILKLFKILQHDLENDFDPRFTGYSGGVNNLTKVKVYKSLYLLHPHSMRKKSSEAPPNYGFVLENDLVFLDSGDIQRVIFWNAVYNERYWLTSGMITGTRGMLDTVQNHPYWNLLVATGGGYEHDSLGFQHELDIDGPYGGYALFNYNSGINEEELKRLVHLKLHSELERSFWEHFWKNNMPKDGSYPAEKENLGRLLLAKKKQAIFRWFWKRGILVVPINGVC